MSDHDSERGDVEAPARAMRLAIARAKCRGSGEVTADDVLAGVLHDAARFGIVDLGEIVIDLEAMGEAPLDELGARGPKVTYSSAASAVIDAAAEVARRDGSPRVDRVHLLAAFAGKEDGLMGRLKTEYDFDGAGWRKAVARWAPRTGRPGAMDGVASRSARVQELLSPDEAADFLGVHTQTVRGYIRSGKLTAHRLAGERALRIRRQDLVGLLEPYEPES